MVGGSNQPIRERARLSCPLRDPDRNLDRNLAAGAAFRIAAAYLQHAARDQGTLMQCRGRKHDAKFVAARARKQVAWPQTGLGHQGEMLQAGVAGRMSMGIVDGLEAVEIDDEQREWLAAAHGS